MCDNRDLHLIWGLDLWEDPGCLRSRSPEQLVENFLNEHVLSRAPPRRRQGVSEQPRKIVCEPDELGLPPGTMVPAMQDCSDVLEAQGLDSRGRTRLDTPQHLLQQPVQLLRPVDD